MVSSDDAELQRWLLAETERLRGTHAELTALRALARRARDAGPDDHAVIVAELAALARDEVKPWLPAPV